MTRKRIDKNAAAACIIAAALFVATVTGGVCLCRGHSPGGEGKVCLVNLDVCGAGPASVVVQGLDSISLSAAPAAPYIPMISLIPPTPDEAVASAEPGDLDKPPEA